MPAYGILVTTTSKSFTSSTVNCCADGFRYRAIAYAESAR
jgi:hypothetical protein